MSTLMESDVSWLRDLEIHAMAFANETPGTVLIGELYYKQRLLNLAAQSLLNGIGVEGRAFSNHRRAGYPRAVIMHSLGRATEVTDDSASPLYGRILTTEVHKSPIGAWFLPTLRFKLGESVLLSSSIGFSTKPDDFSTLNRQANHLPIISDIKSQSYEADRDSINGFALAFARIAAAENFTPEVALFR